MINKEDALKLKIDDLKLFYSGTIETMKKKEEKLERVNTELLEICKAQNITCTTLYNEIQRLKHSGNPFRWIYSLIKGE
tara:strand:+ start:199 stop:435 length:237 start_codon:yes stop_codon:yes gene_type:complete